MNRFLVVTTLLLVITNNILADNTIDDVLKQIAQNNLTLKALVHQGEAEVLDIQAENALAGPAIEYSPFFRNGYNGIAESELIVSEEIQFPTKYSSRRKKASLHHEMTEQQKNREKSEILLSAKLLCLDIIRVNQTIQMLQERLDGNNNLRLLYAKRMEAGDANILEVNKVELDFMEVKMQLSEVQNDRIVLLQQLQQQNGGSPIDVNMTEFPEDRPIDDYETFVNLALLSDADLHLAESTLRSLKHDVNISQNEWLPNITMGYRRNTEMNEHSNGVLVGLSFPMLWNGSRVKAAKNRQKSAEIQMEQMRLEKETMLRSCYQQMQRLQQVLDHSDVTMLRETLVLMSKALQHGEISALQYYTEINSIYEKLQRHIDVHCQSAKLKAQLHKHELA